MIKKLGLLAIFLILVSSTAVASGHFSFVDTQAPYGSEQNLEVICDPDQNDENCPDDNGRSDIRIEICGHENDVEILDDTQSNDGDFHYFGGVEFPAEAKCDIGRSSMALINTDTGETYAQGGEVLFYPQVQASYLHVGFNYDNENLKQFRLIDDKDKAYYDNGDKSEWNPGDILVTDHNPDFFDGDTTTDNYPADTNFILGRSTSTVLSNLYAGNCDTSENTCKIAENFDYHDDYDTSNCNGECEIGYESGIVDYYGNSEIIMGQRYGDGGPPSSLDYKMFYLCHENLPGTEDTAVYSPGDNYEYDQFICTSTGNWMDTATCGDGFDNDENGATDLDDPSCDSTSESELDEADQCSNPAPQVAELEFIDNPIDPNSDSDYEKGVLHNADPAGEWSVNGTVDGTKCKYNDFDTDVPDSGSSYQFTCYDSVSENEDEFIVGGSLLNTPESYQDRLNYCNSLTEAWPADHPDNISAVEYYVPEKAIPEGRNKFATQYGYKNNFFQNIHDAEQKYVPDCRDVFDDNYCNFVESNDGSIVHANESWDYHGAVDVQDGPVTVDGIDYDGYNPSVESDGEHDYIDSWVTDNASVNTEYIQSSSGTTDTGAFYGGFAPKCQDAEDSTLAWRYVNDEWTCSYPVAEQEEMTVNFFNVPATPDKTTYVGFQINWTELQKWRAPFSTDPAGDSRSYAMSVEAQCWQGRTSERPEDLSQVSNVSQTVEQDKDIQIATSVPDRSGVDSKTYSCLWGFKQNLTEHIEHGELVTDSNDNYYFMSGTNRDEAPINIYPGDRLDPSYSQLETYASNTESVDYELWQKFPKGEDVAVGGDEALRHPGKCYVEDCDEG